MCWKRMKREQTEGEEQKAEQRQSQGREKEKHEVQCDNHLLSMQEQC